MKNRRLSVLVFIVLAIATASTGLAQRNRTSVSRQNGTLLSALPPSDAVALIKVNRVLDEALPKLLAENPTRLAEINAELAKFQEKTGLDPRSFEQLAVGVQYEHPSEGSTKVRTIALARGTFNPAGLVAAGRIASDGKYQEVKHQGKTIYVFTLDQQIKLAGLWDFTIRELAVTSLESNILAMGDLEAVKATIDATKARKHANPELIALATREPNAIVGFGGNMTEGVRDSLTKMNAGVARELTAVRQFYGSLGMTPVDLELTIAARTVDAASAKNLGDTVEGLKQLGSLFVGRLAAPKGDLARSALTNLKITTQGNELQLRTAVAQSQVTPLIRGF